MRRAADSSVVRCKSDHPGEFTVPSVDPNGEITTIGAHVETICVESSPPESPVVSPRNEAAATSVRVSDAVPSPSGQTPDVDAM